MIIFQEETFKKEDDKIPVGEIITFFMHGLLFREGFRLFCKHIGSYIAIRRELESVTRAIDEKVEEIRLTWT